MRAIPLLVTDTDFARDKATKLASGFRTDDELYDPMRHEPTRFSYRQHFRTILNAPLSEQGLATPEDVERSIRILRKLRALNDGDVLVLDEDDWRHLDAKLQGVKLSVIYEWIEDCKEAVKEAERVDDADVAAMLDSKANGRHPDPVAV